MNFQLSCRWHESSLGTAKVFTGIVRDVTERKEAEQSLRKLSAHIIRLQDEERRRIGRELHDSAGQYLAAASRH
jgi:signal transduction histidine kinase